MTTDNMYSEAGFSLIELLVVTLMMGLVMGAVSTLYVSHQRSATVEAEVVDVQQNLRLAMDLIGQDVSMADRKSTRLNSSHIQKSRMPSSA